ncbi:MAG TPA: alkaline phosphatase family protein [Gaiellaceae bacterium]|nr:alkaline phosphatase family protein [Gaiellaceae bacterium]
MPAKKLVLIVIDGLTPTVLEQAVEERTAPALAFLAAHGDYRRAVTTFPSLTPVCLSSLATGAHPDVHHIPHLVWYHAGERRLVEYGSSFGAIRAAGATRSMRDAIFNLNAEHLSKDAVTVFESLDDAGLETATVNMVCYRGRSRHRATLPGLTRSVYGPRRFFYFNLFESDVTGAPLAVRTRSRGSVDEYAARVGRWLVTRDGFDFFLFYLPDYDFASHVSGPDGARAALVRTDRAVAALLEAAGGPDEFLARYAVLVCSDHGQTNVTEAVRLEDALRDFTLLRPGRERADVAVTASNRAAMVYALPGSELAPGELADRLEGAPGVDVVLFLDEGEAVARRMGEEVRFAPANGGFTVRGDVAVLPYPHAFERAWAALANPNAGDLIAAAAPGVEFVDLGGRHHAGGGSHGSLEAGDSEVPMLAVGLDPPERLVEVAPAILRHFGVEPPAYARRPIRVA